MVKLRDIKLKSWDNCYTFALKYLGIFEKYQDIELDEFIKLFPKDFNVNEFNTLDLIVFQAIENNYKPCVNEIQDGFLIENYKHNSGSFHFLVVIDSEYIIDFSYRDDKAKDYYIRIRKIKELNFESKEYYVYKVKYST